MNNDVIEIFVPAQTDPKAGRMFEFHNRDGEHFIQFYDISREADGSYSSDLENAGCGRFYSVEEAKGVVRQIGNTEDFAAIFGQDA